MYARLLIGLVGVVALVATAIAVALLTENTPQAVDLSTANDSEILAVASESFRDEYVASLSGAKYDKKIAERLRSVIQRRAELALSTQEVGNLVRWVGQYKGPETTKLLIELMEQPLDPVISDAQLWLLVACQSGIGNEGATVEGLEYLKRMTTEEYWLKREVQPQCPECPKGYKTPSDFRMRGRIGAFHYLYFSGTQYALDSLRKGEAFPADILEPKVFDAAIEYVEACLRGERPANNSYPSAR
jgi:hypothetical protein